MLSALNPNAFVQTRPFNFAPGPAAIPESVLQQAASEMLNWNNSQVSVMEMSHRSPEFMSIYEQAVQNFKELLKVPDHFKILFMQGGGIGQNAIVPLNISQARAVDFVITGAWSERSEQEAQKYCSTHIAADATNEWAGFYGVPDFSLWKIRSEAKYVHICSNETVHGVEYQQLPDLKAMTGHDIPLVVDASSHILTRSINWSKIGLLFAGAQKNIGPAGLTMVFVREDLLDLALHICPTAFNYQVIAKAQSAYNTPPVYAIYMTGLVLQWVKAQGGVPKMEENALIRSQLIYSCIDDSNGFYSNPVQKENRSRMNIPFLLKDQSLEALFVEEARQNGLLNIKGHKMLGGMRASVYNAMPIEGAKALVDFMKGFAQKHG